MLEVYIKYNIFTEKNLNFIAMTQMFVATM